MVGAYRNRRRDCETVQQLAGRIDAAVQTYLGDPAFATALLARLNVATGRLTWTACGHPQPLHARRGAKLPDLEVLLQGAPLGLGVLAPVAGETVEIPLEPDERHPDLHRRGGQRPGPPETAKTTSCAPAASSSARPGYGTLLEREHASGSA